MITIRRATPQDGPAIGTLHINAVKAIRTHYSPDEIAAWAVPRSLESYLQLIETREFYVAVDANTVIGFGVLNPERSEVEAVYVSPDQKGKGVGRKLLAELEQRARSLGLNKLSLNASLNAFEFYKRVGYVGQEESTYRLLTGVEIRCVPMTKVLDL